MSKTETLVGWNLNSDHPLSQAKYQPTANTPLVVLETKFTFLIQKCAYLIKVRISQSSHWWEQAVSGFQDNTHITRIQPGSLLRKWNAINCFLQTTNYRLCSASGVRITLLSLQNFSTRSSKHSYQSLTPAVAAQQLSLLKYTKSYQLDHPKQDNYCGRK